MRTVEQLRTLQQRAVARVTTHQNPLLEVKQNRNVVHIVGETPEDILQKLLSGEPLKLKAVKKMSRDQVSGHRHDSSGNARRFHEEDDGHKPDEAGSEGVTNCVDGEPPKPKGVTAASWQRRLDDARRQGIRPGYVLPEADEAHKTLTGLEANVFQTLCRCDELRKTLEDLYTFDTSALTETGTKSAHVVIGKAVWKDPNFETTRTSPLVLTPVQIVRSEESRADYSIQIGDEGPFVNPALIAQLRTLTNRDGLDGDPARDIENVLKDAQTIVENVGGHVRREAYIANLALPRYSLFKDLAPEAWRGDAGLAMLPHVEQLLSARHSTPIQSPADPEDNGVADAGPHIVTHVDASQLGAIVDAHKGRSFAIEGPPGTGKSETICNIIADALWQGRTVLFIAEKAVALDVVQNRMTAFGLGEFITNLHKEKSRYSIYQALMTRLNMPPMQEDENVDAIQAELRELHQELSDYKKALDTQYGAIGWRIGDILWRELELRSNVQIPEALQAAIPLADVDELDSAALNHDIEILRNVKEACEPILEYGGSIWDHPWSGVDSTMRDPGKRLDLMTGIRTLADHLDQLDALSDTFLETFSQQPLSVFRECIAGATSIGDRDSVWPAVTHIRAAGYDTGTLKTASEAYTRQKEAYATIQTVSVNPEACLSSYDLLDRTLRELAQVSGLAYVHDIYDQANDLNEERYSLESALAGGRKIALALGLRQVPSDRLTLRRLLAIVGIVARASPEALSAWSDRIATANPEQAYQTLAGAVDAERRLRRDRYSVEQVFAIPWSDVNAIDNLQAYAHTLRSAGWPGTLKRSVRQARDYARSRSLRTDHTDDETLARDLDAAATILAAWQTLKHPDVLKYCDPDHRPLEDRVTAYKEAADLARRLRRQIDGKLPYDREVVGALFERGGVKLTTLMSLARDFDVRQLSKRIKRNDTNDLDSAVRTTRSRSERLDRIARNLKTSLRIHGDTTIEQLKALPKAVENYHSAQREIETYLAATSAMTVQPALEAIVRLTDVGLTITETLEILDPDEGCLDAIQLQDQAIDETLEQIERTREDIRQIDHVSGDWLIGDADTSLGNLSRRVQQLNADDGTLADWLHYCDTRQEAEAHGIAWIVDLYLEAGEPLDAIENGYRYAVFNSLMKNVFAHYPILKAMTSDTGDQKRRRYRELHVSYQRMNRHRLRSQLLNRPQEGSNTRNTADDAEGLQFLQHEVAKQGVHPPIRELLARSGETMKSLTPCFMMSPTAVADYLPRQTGLFDLVIFDEASQVRPEEAFGAIARGQQAIVVGDSWQLPPASGNTRSAAGSGEGPKAPSEDTESILDMAMSAWSPFHKLTWHYRSRHEDLIAFSNQRIYENRLSIIPANRAGNALGNVDFRHVSDGVFDAAANEREADVVTRTAAMELKRNPDRSLGIIATTRQQADKLRSRMQRLLRDDHELKAIVDSWETDRNGLERFFIKDLVNAQGDERDRILVSLTFGPNRKRQIVPQHFEPLIGPYGHRYLNVLITRARYHLIFFSSLLPQDIPVTSTANAGRTMLHDFLEFAASSRYDTMQLTNSPENDLQTYIAQRLESQGYALDAQIGTTGCFLELGVKDPDAPESAYLLGLESDGATENVPTSTLDRECVRPLMYTQRGWTLRRVWSSDWYADPDGQTRRLHRELKRRIRSDDD